MIRPPPSLQRSRTGRFIVFTHNCRTDDERAREPRQSRFVRLRLGSSAISGASWRSEAVVMWGFGHTHYSCDFIDEHGTRVVANQKGCQTTQEKEFAMSRMYHFGRE